MSNNKDFLHSNQHNNPSQFSQQAGKSNYINLFEDKLSKKNSFFEKRKKEINVIKFKSNEEIMNENKVNSFFSSQIQKKQQFFINFYNEDLTIRHERMVLTDNSSNSTNVSSMVRNNISNLSIILSIDYNNLTYEEIIDLQKYKNTYKVNEIHENHEDNQRNNIINPNSQVNIANSNSNEKSNFLLKMKNSIIYIMQEVNKDERFTVNDLKKYLFVSFKLPKLIYDMNIESYCLIEIDDSCLLLMKKEGKNSNFKSFYSNTQGNVSNSNSDQSNFYIINEKNENQQSQLQQIKNKHMLLKEKYSEKEKEVLFLTSKIESEKNVYNKIINDEREKLEGIYKEKLILHNKNSLFKFEEMINLRKKEFEEMKNEIILRIDTKSKKEKEKILNNNIKCNCIGNDNSFNTVILNKPNDFISNFKKNHSFSIENSSFYIQNHSNFTNSNKPIVIIDESDYVSINNYFITQSICSYCLLKPSHPNLFSCNHAFLCKECFDSIREDNKKGSFKEIVCPYCKFSMTSNEKID